MPPPGCEAAECRSCKAPIYWVTTDRGKKMPIDRGAEPRVVVQNGTAYVRQVYRSHFSSCPNADNHRRPRG